MIIGDFWLPYVQIPKAVHSKAEFCEVYLHKQDVPFTADTWMSCAGALPHIDRSESDEDLLIATLCVKGSHFFGDDQMVNGRLIEPGTLFIVDPGAVHWMFDNKAFHKQERPGRFISVQWEIARKDFSLGLFDVIKQLESVSGQGINWRCNDERYPTHDEYVNFKKACK